MYKTFSILVIQNSSDNLQQLFHKNLPTVISHKYSDLSLSCRFSIILVHITSNQAHVNLGKLGAKKLKLLLVAARRNELSVRLV